jgi:hypothetical protein
MIHLTAWCKCPPRGNNSSDCNWFVKDDSLATTVVVCSLVLFAIVVLAIVELEMGVSIGLLSQTWRDAHLAFY